MAAIARSRPQPLAQHIFVPVRKKYAYVRMKEMLSNALGGRNAGLYGSLSGMSAGGTGGEVGDGERRTSLGGSGRVAAAAGPVRKASTTSVGNGVVS